MRQSNTARVNNRRVTLRVVKGGTYQQSGINHLVNTAWNFASSALWNCTQFSTREIETAKEKIIEYLHLFKNPQKGFLIFCQLVVPARYYIIKNTGHYIPQKKERLYSLADLTGEGDRYFRD